MIAHLLNRPFEREYLNVIEFLSLTTSFVTFFFGQMLYLQAETEFHQIVTIAILSTNVLFVCVCLAAIAKSLKSTIGMLRQDYMARTMRASEMSKVEFF